VPFAAFCSVSRWKQHREKLHLLNLLCKREQKKEASCRFHAEFSCIEVSWRNSWCMVWLVALPQACCFSMNVLNVVCCSSMLPALPPYLSHGPPVLLHPERVVPLSECQRFERSFQPNVALAPFPSSPHRTKSLERKQVTYILESWNLALQRAET